MKDAAGMKPEQFKIGTDEFELVHPGRPAPGLLVAIAKKTCRKEILELQSSGVSRVWTVRATIGTAVPLSGSPQWAVGLEGDSNFVLNENPLSIYLHFGGHKAVYFDLRSTKGKELNEIDVQVESELPSNALLLARRPINALLDVLSRNSHVPLLIQQLQLLSPLTKEILIYELPFPQGQQIEMGPLGGIQQAVPFAPYDAIYREALTSSSPFYRLLCGARIFEGADSIRTWMKQECERRGVKANMPAIPKTDNDLLRDMGLPEGLSKNVKNAKQLYDKLQDLRNAIAHFLFKQGDEKGHAYLADGNVIHTYSAAAAVLLHYAHLMLEELRLFYVQHLPMMGSHILPMLSYREKFIVKAKEFGLK